MDIAISREESVGNTLHYYRDVVKPLFSRVIALLLLPIGIPVMLLIAAVLVFYRGRRLIFLQKRIGYRDRVFVLFKFSTLLDRYDAHGQLLHEHQRQFAFGTFLRHFHLDELPQLINMLSGDLCFIGPRPLLVEYLPHYTSFQRRRHNCRPGITGLSQIAGGNLLGWPHRLRLDVFYAEHCSLLLDIVVLLRSVRYFARKKLNPSKESLFAESYIDYRKRKGI